MKKKIGTTVVKNNILYGLGNVRLAPHYVKHLINPFYNQTDLMLDVGCGDGIMKYHTHLSYEGIDIGAGIYDEVDDKSVTYIRNTEEMLKEISLRNPDVSLLINVLEHTYDFTSLLEAVLSSTKKAVIIALPNEENIHNIISMILGTGINNHTLREVGLHDNHRHLWFIQMGLALSVISGVCEKYNFRIVKKLPYIAYPTTKWKRVLYKIGTFLLPLRWRARGFALRIEKHIYK
jgi:hypothetical protein